MVDHEVIAVPISRTRVVDRVAAERSRIGALCISLALVVVVAVVGLGPGGQAATFASGHAAASVACPEGITCIDVNATRPEGPARHVAEGFIHGVDPTTDSAMVAALHPRSWVYSGDQKVYAQARDGGAAVTFVLSDAWAQATYQPALGGPVTPWDHLAQFTQFIQKVVAAAQAPGHHVDYWEVQNEPDGLYGKVRPTVAQALAEFGAAVRAIRSVDPNARISGPNISAYNDQPGGKTLDLSTFLDYVVANHIRLDALAWHEVGARVSPAYNPPDPDSVLLDVQRARRLIQARPGLLVTPKIFINEYQSADDHLIPGWTVGWMAALEQAGVDAADRACWHGTDLTGNRVSECREGLDGLFVPGTSLPQAVYSVHRAYASMTGYKVPTSTTDRTLTALATIDYSSRTVQVLVGRHASCTPEVRTDCHRPGQTPLPAPVQVELDLPWTSSLVTANVARIPNVPGPMLGPAPALAQTLSLVPGPVVVSLPLFADGDAYIITVKVSS